MKPVDPAQRPLFPPVRRWGMPPQGGIARHAPGSETSKAAAAKVTPKLAALQRAYLEALDDAARRGRIGLTDHEASDLLKRPLSSINGRRNELMDTEHFNPPLVVDSGDRRTTKYNGEATVWQRNPITKEATP